MSKAFVHFGMREKIGRDYHKWLDEEGVADTPNSFVVFLDCKDWLNNDKIFNDLKDNWRIKKNNYKEDIAEKLSIIISYLKNKEDLMCKSNETLMLEGYEIDDLIDALEIGIACTLSVTTKEIVNYIEMLRKENNTHIKNYRYGDKK